MLDRKISNGAHLIISQADRYNVYAVDKKVQDNLPTSKQSQSDGSTQSVVPTKQGLMTLFPDWFTGFTKFQGEQYIEVDTSVQPKKTPCRPVLIHQQATISRNENCRYHQAS